MNIIKKYYYYLAFLIIFSSLFTAFSMDKPLFTQNLDYSSSLFGLPDPFVPENRLTLIKMLTTNSPAETLEEAVGFINRISKFRDFKIFLNIPQNFIEIVRNLGDIFDVANMEICNAITVNQSAIQSSLQKKLNSLCNKQKSTAQDTYLFTSLIEEGANIDFTTDLLGEKVTPLILAIINNNIEMVRLLLKANADPNRGIYEGNTPLIMCILKNNPKFVKLLLKAGSNINLPNTENIYPLEIAKKVDNKKIINMIRESIKTRNKYDKN